MKSQPILDLIKSFKKFPAVGERTAERYVYHLLKSGRKEVLLLAENLKKLSENIKSCPICFDFSDISPCKICSDPRRNKKTICVVEKSQDIEQIEKTASFKGVYHSIRGMLDLIEESEIELLKINELEERVKNSETEEIILALSPNIQGETTSMYIVSRIKKINPEILITRLARGIPVGSDVEYMDEITLENALKNRTKQ
jgi:recombination protein RecR